MYCFHWNSWLLEHITEVINTQFWGKKKRSLQLLKGSSTLFVLPVRVIPALLLHGIAREHDFPIYSLSLACLISEQPPHCTGSPWSVQWLWFSLLLLKRSCSPKYDQHNFPCHLLKYLPLHCSCALLSCPLRARQWFLTVVYAVMLQAGRLCRARPASHPVTLQPESQSFFHTVVCQETWLHFLPDCQTLAEHTVVILK